MVFVRNRTYWGKANNSVGAGHSYRRSHIMGVFCIYAKKFGLFLLHGDCWWILSREVGVTYIYILER